jgi:DNA-binding XRE family transcriptional regulator
MSEKKFILDAYQWSYDRYIKDDPELVEFSKDIRQKAGLAQQIYDIREKLRMTRDDLAEFSGLSAETIEDLEETDYDGDWNDAIQKVNAGFHNWLINVILPVARMKPEELSVKIAS